MVGRRAVEAREGHDGGAQELQVIAPLPIGAGARLLEYEGATSVMSGCCRWMVEAKLRRRVG